MAEDKSAKGRLDRNQPHAQVYGCEQGRIWEQGGRFFNGDGTPWRDPSGKTAPTPTPTPAVAATPDAEPVEDDQLSAQLKG